MFQNFAKPLQNPFASVGGIPWWLSDGIPSVNCIAAYQPKSAPSLTASYVNIANPGTHNAVPVVAPTWDSVSGWIFDGSTQYLKTGGIVHAENWSLIVRFSNVILNNSVLVGAQTGADARLLVGAYYDGGAVYGHGSAQIVSPGLANGVLCQAGQYSYRNGVVEGSAVMWSGVNTEEMYIGRDNYTPPFYSNAKIQAVAIYNIALNAATVWALSIAMSAL